MDELPRYQVQYTEPAEIEIDAEHLRLADIVSEQYADRWQDSPLEKIDSLVLFPASHEVAPENVRYDVEVRRLLYHGPSRRRGGTSYRVLFHIIEPPENEQGQVIVLHVWHGAQQPRA